MNIGLIGYGKMGKAIEKIALDRGHKITAKSNSQNPITNIDFSKIDVAIEFSEPNLALNHIKYCVEKNTPIIVGTTAWEDNLPMISDYVKENNGSMLHASNFSIGVNIFFEINKKLARLISFKNEYKPSIEETHHTEKKDSPSGTAISLVKDIIHEKNKYDSWILQKKEVTKKSSNQIPIKSIRKEQTIGQHEITYESHIDTIKIKHIAKNRDGFALGSIIAAEWIINKKGVFTMHDLIK